MDSIWKLSQHRVLSYYYSFNILVTPLSPGQNILQIDVVLLASGNWDMRNRSLKLVVGAVGQIVPTRLFIYVVRKDFPKCGLGICPMATEMYSLVPANAASAEHILQTLLAFWRNHSLCWRKKDRSITDDFYWQSILFQGMKNEVIYLALWHFSLGIGHIMGACYMFLYTNVELRTL